MKLDSGLCLNSIERKYPAALGYEDDFVTIIKHWRSKLASEGSEEAT
jgi:hypothetical protein